MINTSRKPGKCWLATIIIFSVLLIDQISKIWVKTHFYLGESETIFSWFQLVFIQNNGMAFGWEIGSKLLLTLLRIVTVAFLLFYIVRVAPRREARIGYIVCLALIVAGAAGNIIDCVFYGLVFNNPMPPYVATLFPSDGGYGTLFHGLVVDMLYFPLCEWNWPDWMPWVGGEHFIFFRPVFNIADAAISVGMIALVLFYSNQISQVPFRKECQKEADRLAENEKKETK
ncbi:MAG: lipoprotein signal peptidase [Muribaculaceae bacterium]|nr:lipoprotein signal peptidase [Muribaculaceae bacterium]